MLLHVLGHVHTDHVLLVVEQVLRQRAGELRLADTRRPKEDEAADGAVRVAQPRPRAPDRVRHGLDGGVLADDALVQPLLDVEQPLGLALKQPVYRDPRPARDQGRDVVGVDRHVVFSFGQPFASPPVLVPQPDSPGA